MNERNSMNNDLYYKALGYDPDSVKELGGQELILVDIMACLRGCETIYIPYNCPSLEEACGEQGIHMVTDEEPFDAIYWGTPTIVNNRALFIKCLDDPATAHKWTVDRERHCSTLLRALAEDRRAKRIITGLGSGDITLKMRLDDMGGGRVVSYKQFGPFQDWVLVRDL